MSERYEELVRSLREIGTLASVAGLLGWDQETMMPAKAAPGRAEELALVSGLVHQRATSPRLGELIAACEADPELRSQPRVAANLREIRRDHERALKLPESLVVEINQTSSLALEAWKDARRRNDFESFRPWLEKQFSLARRKAECYGAPTGGELYDTLVDDFEPGMSGAQLEGIFGPLREALTPLIAEIIAAPDVPDQAVHELEIPIELQREFNLYVLRQIGFDSDAGRLDVSVHPFSSGVAPGDTRITTRFRDHQFADALGSTMHEAGHALYEQGLPKSECWGQPLSEAMGLGTHESQSRLWENHVGRSRSFWVWALPQAQRAFGAVMQGRTVDELYRAVNTVRPNLIRVESDEATYNLHIMLRFDLERAMLRGDLPIRDLPHAWNERVEKDLSLTVPDDARGCLQDIHWSMGSIGYFPTYTLGNLYAAQYWEKALEQIPDLPEQMAQGRFESLLDWLRRNIHARGRELSARELCIELTGAPLGHEPLMRHLIGKLRAVYRIGPDHSGRVRAR